MAAVNLPAWAGERAPQGVLAGKDVPGVGPGVLPSPASTAVCQTDGCGVQEVDTDPQALGFGPGS